MHMTDEQITSFARGCVAVRREDNGFFFERMTEGLRRVYGAAEGSDTRACCPAAVRLRFRSDTTSLKVGLRFARAARPVYTVGLLVDGAFVGTFGSKEPVEQWVGDIFSNDDAQVREFDLWLPCLVEAWVESLEVDDGCALEPAPATPGLWLAVGDSITQGMTVPCPTQTFVAATALALGVDVHCTGVGGGKMLPEVGIGANPIECTFATVAFGVNDWNNEKPVALFREQTRALLNGLIEGRAELPVGLMTPLPVFGRSEVNKDGVALEAFRQVLRDVAAELKNVTLIEGRDLVTPQPDRFVDGVHPNELGMAEIARALAPRLCEMTG